MSDFLERISKLSPKRLALLALELQEKLEAAAGGPKREPIAVIGMACRIPGGVSDPQAFWDLLREGRDAIREVPADRWAIDDYFDPDPDVPARMAVRSGGFLENVDGFDHSFFGISPREAQTMDPQQRLLLEVAWEALEHAGVAPDRLSGSPTGVFVGVCNSDHFLRVLMRGDEKIDAYLASGNAHSVASGRISYFLGLQGPSLSIDTACSSSLVALHVACQSLHSGESRMALAAGVNLMCTPETMIALSQAHMLAPDGRCKTFDAAADGFSRGEGCGVLVLKRLSDAVADGDRVLAVIRGSAANQDGRSGGLTVPNGPAQEAVIRSALADAKLTPADVDYVEAHGTGTTLGDPIEVRALAGALGPGRDPSRPLVIGSVKTNIGHLESAAGVAGVMKVILALQNERIPPHLHFKQASPHIAWADYPVVVKREGQAWPRSDRKRIAGVSSFGFSGTNAHVVLEEAPLAGALAVERERPLSVLPISARSEPALVELAKRYDAALATLSYHDAAHTAGVGRSRFGERAAIVAGDAAAARAALGALAKGEAHEDLHRGSVAAGSAPEVVFLFTGAGCQYPGMSRLLYDTAPVFRDVIDRCDAILGADPQGRTLKSVLFESPGTGNGDDAPIHEIRWTQPALFAVEYGVAQLWRSWGVEPAAVIGHSAGEYVAACVAGVFSLEEGIALLAERGRLMQELPSGGTMAAIFAPSEEVEAVLAPMKDKVSIAAMNAADSVVIAGEISAVEKVLADFAARNVKGHRLYIQLAAHSPLMEPALGPMEAAASKVAMRAPNIPVAWNLTGGAALPNGAPDATYWRKHMREPVRFAEGIASLHKEGYRVFLEVGPHPTLIALAQRTLPEDVTYVTSLRRGKDDWRELMTGIAQLYVKGAPIDFAAVDKPYARKRVVLPTYPFQRRSWWIDTKELSAHRGPPTKAGANALLGRRLPSACPIFESSLTTSSAAYLAEHRVQGAALVAGPVFAELAQAAAREAHGPAPRAIESFVIHQPLVLGDDAKAVQTSLGEPSGGAIPFAIHSRAAGADGAWTLHVSGRLTSLATKEAAPPALPLRALEAELGPPASTAAHYEERLRALGIELGGPFRSVHDARRRDREVLATLVLAPSCAKDTVAWAHPALLDGAFQAVGLAVPETADTGDVYLLTAVDRLALFGALPERVLCHVKLLDAASPRPAEHRAEVTLAREDGSVVGVLQGVSLRRASREALARAAGATAPATSPATKEDLFYRVAWEPAPLVLRATRALEDPAKLVPGLRERFTALARDNLLAVYDQLLPELDRLSVDHVAVALAQLGFDGKVGRVLTADAEAARLGVVSKHRRLFGRMLEMLAEDGVLHRTGTSFEVFRALPAADPAARYDALLARFGETSGELSMLRRCGGELARVLRGEQDSLQLLFPGGSFAEARKLYVESPYARTYNGALVEALKGAIAGLPTGARLRILEIGAGTGGTTSFVLPALPADRVEYTFTDLSPLFLERAAESFAKYPFLKTSLLDIERDPAEQGFENGAYDVVIAANVLHATADLGQSIMHAKQLLASGGLLLLLEGVAPERWVDLTFGLTEGWWRFTDTTFRASYPLVDRRAWLQMLLEQGFTSGAAIPDAASARGADQQALVIARAPVRRKRWLLITSGGTEGLGSAVYRRLRARGDEVTTVPVDAHRGGGGANLASADEVVYLGAADLFVRNEDAAGIARARAIACEEPLAWLTRFARGELSGRVWLVTRGAQPAAGPVENMWQSPLWGLGRVFALEHPGRWGGLVDLPIEGTPDAIADTLVGALDGDDGEDQTAWRAGARLTARLLPSPTPEARPLELRPDATYLVTGGFGGLGLLVARWMAEHGARHIALLGRRPDPTAEGVRAVEALGAEVISLAGDVTDEAAMTAVFDRLAREAPPLRGIMHAAADLSAAPLGQLTEEQLTKTLRPKIDATVTLDRLGQAKGLDFLVLFSSTTALFGAAGLAHYAAANAFLDAFAQAKNEARRVLSVNWGTWEAMRLASAESQQGFRDAGLEPMPAAKALDALARLLGSRTPQSVVASIEWSILKPLHEARRRRPFLAHLSAAEASPARSPTRAESGPSLKERLAGAPPSLRHELLVGFVRREVGAVLRIESDAVPLETGLFELGMDSLMSVELKRRLERGAAHALPSTLTFNYPNVSALAAFLDRELNESAELSAAATAAKSTSAAPPPTPSADLDALSDAELEARLRARLERHR